jgi:hypothetical protein
VYDIVADAILTVDLAFIYDVRVPNKSETMPVQLDKNVDRHYDRVRGY